MAFIGRERELAVLGAALQRAAGGEPTRVAICGPLGIGISTLVDELALRLASQRDVTICRARCFAPYSGVPYGAIRNALAGVLAALHDDRLSTVLGSAADDIAELIPELRSRIHRISTVRRADDMDVGDQRGAQVRESLLGVIARLGSGGPVCLVVEDLELSDPGTREFVSALLRTSRRLPLAIVVTYHSDELPRGHAALGLIREIEDSPLVESIRLAPLTRDEMASLVAGQQEEHPTMALVAAVMEGSRGNPLVATQLVAAHQRLAGLRLSDPLDEILHARLAKLDAPATQALRVLAAAHRPLPQSVLARIRLPDGHLRRNAVAAALESELAVADGDRLTIVHELCAEAIEQSMIPAERHALHAALAAEAEGAHGSEPAHPAEAAWHWQRAARPSDARRAHIAAAESAMRLEPGATALAHYTSALELDDEEPDDISLLTAAAAAAAASGAFRRAAALAEQAIARLAGGRAERLLSAARHSPARIVAGELSECLGRYRRLGGDSVGARQAFELALELIPDELSAARARAIASLAQDLMLEGRFEESAELAETARAMAHETGPAALAELAHASDTLGVDLAYLGEIDRGLALLDEAMTTARAAGRLDEVMRCYANRTTLLDLDTRRERALSVVKEGIAEANRVGLGLTYGAFLRGNAADSLFQLGRWEESEAECRAAMEFPPAGVAWFSPTLYLGLVLVESRADEEAGRLVGRALLQLESVPAGQWSALVMRTAVNLALWRGELDDARNAAEQGWDSVLETEDAGQIAYAAAAVLEACAASAERGRARRNWSEIAAASELANRVMPLAEQSVARHQLPKSAGSRREAELYLKTARAHHDRVRGRTSPETWAALAEGWAQVPIPYQVAKSRWWQAQAALPTRARRGEARKALHEAWRIASELPARPLLRALRDLAQRGRINLPDEYVVIPIEPEPRGLVAVGPGMPADDSAEPEPAAPGHVQQPAEIRFGLSPRENSVLIVLSEGRTNREIAERLFISERTVAVHVRRILAKLGVGGRTEAAGLAIRLRLVPDDPRTAAAELRAADSGPGRAAGA